eukprot:snap_masked-scaffold_10-processed-gene-2.17-mRNA-1 protein AED:1.00 eAED:1.00 QI:0/-1/0/0/-1/1/1/0/256
MFSRSITTLNFRTQTNLLNSFNKQKPKTALTTSSFYKNQNFTSLVLPNPIIRKRIFALRSEKLFPPREKTIPSSDYKTQKLFFRALFIIGTSLATADTLSQLIQAKFSLDPVHEADVSFQRLFSGVDLHRSFTMFFIGSTITGPVSQLSQMFIEKFVPGKSPIQICKKIATSFALGFSVSIPLFFTATTLFLKNGSLVDVKKKIEDDLLDSLKVGIMYWPLINIFVFRFVNVHNRAIVNTFFSGLWNVYLSSVANN